MPFNSIDFAIFLPIVFLLYWFVTNKNLKLQNFLLVAASYVFYGWWDWRFLSLILFSTIVDYSIGLKLDTVKKQRNRNILLWISILVNLGLLGFFKYYNFFVDNFITAFSFFGKDIQYRSLDIILPVGISFYTFQTLSYTIDVYKRKLAPTKDFIAFAAFVSFFPQLVAGPIERATQFLPQFQRKRHFDYSQAIDGLRQILWGLFTKVVIADRCAEFANEAFNPSSNMNGSSLALGAIFFAFQIYGDFSGYSDIAIGTAKLFNFNLMRNFNFPYFSRDVAEFWRRWHISLSTWFRDYVYIPLGGSRGNSWMKVRNTFLIFIISGFWHGANWTFIVWGALNAIYFLPLLLTQNNRHHIEIIAKGKLFPNLKEFILMILTFTLTVFSWIFFRANSVNDAFIYIGGIFSDTLLSNPEFTDMVRAKYTLLILILFIFIEWMGREEQYAIARLGLKWKRPLRYALYYSIVIAILFLGGREQEFIYFQF